MFEDLLPEPYNSAILRLLFTMAQWHGLAKLRLHTDITIDQLEEVTTRLGQELRDFQTKICPAFQTKELPREVNARKRREAKNQSANSQPGSQGERKTKTLNLQTYKLHSLGDYGKTIRKYGTTDSYSTEPVGLYFSL